MEKPAFPKNEIIYYNFIIIKDNYRNYRLFVSDFPTMHEKEEKEDAFLSVER